MKYYNEELVQIINFYDSLCESVKNFGKENLTPAQEKRVVKSVKQIAEQNNLTIHKSDVTYKELMDYFKIKIAEYNEVAKCCDEHNYAVAEKLGEDFNYALSCFNQSYEYFWLNRKDNDVELILIDNNAFTKKLLLKDAIYEAGSGYFKTPLWTELSESEDKYCVEIAYNRLFGEPLNKFKIIFSSYEVSTQVYNAMNVTAFSSPWDYLDSVARSLLLKARYAPDCVNEKERELLPLAEALINIPELPDTKYDRELEYDKQEPLGVLAKEMFFYDDIAKLIEKKKLCIRTLCNKKHEGLWRVIYNKFLQSQEEYANSSEVICEKEALQERRNKITYILRGSGYKGEYPDFYKDGDIMRPKEVTTYSKNVVVAFQKNCRYHIKCIEQGEDILFICGYVCVGKEPMTNNDAFSAGFYDRGKRYFRTVTYFMANEDFFENDFAETLEVCATVAVKKAQALKLAKDEREHFAEDHYDIKEKISFVATLMILCALAIAGSSSLCILVVEMLFGESFSEALKTVWENNSIFIGGGVGLVYGLVASLFELRRSRK